jgi:iron complex outermembrane receptor protein
LAPAFRITAGARITHDDIFGVATGDTTGFVIGNTFNGTISGKLKETNLSFRAAAEYDATRNVMAYLTVARGYKAPSFGGSTGLARVKSEIPTNVEAGVKSMLFDRKLQFNVAVYHTLFKNFQAQAFDPVTLGFPLTNAGDVRSQGVEVDFRAAPVEGLTLNGGLAFNDAIYKNYKGVGCYYGQPSGTSGRNVCLPNLTVDVTGNQIAYAPKFSGSVSAEYERPVSSTLKGFVDANYYHRSSVYFTAVRDPKTRVTPFGIVGGSVGVETNDSAMRFSVFARNLLDKRIPTFIVPDITAPFNGDAAIGGDYWQQFGETSFRTIGASLDLRF